MARHGGFAVAGHRHDRHAQALEHGQQHRDFGTLAAVGDGQHHIIASHHAQVAMAGFARVHKEGGRTGRCQGCGNLAAHMATFAHAGDHHPAPGGQHALHHLDKIIVQALRHGQNGLGLDREGGCSQLENLRRLDRTHGLWSAHCNDFIGAPCPLAE
ncbi:hypothetical protein D3C72_1954640 [compost metagenome]